MKSISTFCLTFFGVFVLMSCTVEPITTTTNDGGSSTTSTTTTTLAFGEAVYVSASGDDANSGMYFSSPVRSLSNALAIAAASNVNYLLVSGDYVLSANVNYTNGGWVIAGVSNLIVKGGWSSDFSSMSSASKLSGDGSCERVVIIDMCRNVTLTNLQISAGKETGTSLSVNDLGSGVAVWYSEGITLACDVSDNTNGYYGGGVGLWYSTNCTVGGRIHDNTAQYGAGAFVAYSAQNDIEGIIFNNTATWTGGGLYAYNCNFNHYTGTICNNTANSGGGIGFYSGSYNLIDAVISNNTALSTGGGIYSSMGSYNTNTATIRNNSAVSLGGGVYLYRSTRFLINGTISGNSAMNGGGIYITENGLLYGYTTISATVSNNSALTNGGGIYVYDSTYHDTFNGVIGNNRAGAYGGGIYLTASSHNNAIDASAVIQYNHCDYDNNGSETGGGIYNLSGDNTLSGSATVTNNYRGSGTSVIDNTVGF